MKLDFFKLFERKAVVAKKYSGISDFFLNASESEKKRVLTEAAHKANEDQFRVLERAQLRAKASN